MRGRTIALIAAVALMTVPAAATETQSEPPVIVDPAGDANGLWLLVEGPDTRPASDDRLDLLEIWPETTYDVVQETEGGAIVAVRHVPRALRINVRTLAPAIPSTGPTARFEVPVQADGCFIEFRFHAHGPLSGPDDPAQEPTIAHTPPEGVSTGGGCLEQTLRSDSFTLDTEENVTSMTFPFEALVGTPVESLVAPGIRLEAGRSDPMSVRVRRPGPEPFIGVVGLAVDAAPPLPRPFVIGSDVPPDIDCRETPQESACEPA